MPSRSAPRPVAPPGPVPGRPRPAPVEHRGARGAAVLVAAGVLCLVPACGGTASSSGTASSGGSPSAPSSAPASSSGGSTAAAPSSGTSAAAVRTLQVYVTGKQVTPAPARVPLGQGERLRLVVTIDHDDEIHVHGFEVEREATAGRPVTIDLTGAEPGLYEVETHHPPLRLLQILVR